MEFEMKIQKHNQIFSEHNHLYSHPEIAFKVFEINLSPRMATIVTKRSVQVINHTDDKICTWMFENQTYWIRQTDYAIIIAFIDQKNTMITNYKWGYVAGTMLPYGPIKDGLSASNKVGYEIWQEMESHPFI